MIYFLFSLFFTFTSKAGGIPVVDTNALINEIKDSAYLLDSVGGLIEEIGIASDEAQQLFRLQEYLNGLASDIRTLQSFSDDVTEIGQFQRMKGMILADRIRAFTRHLRKIKRVVATAMSLRARPQAILVTLQLLEEERQRENEKLQAKLMAEAEMEKINEVRNKVKHEIARKEQLQFEMNNIFKSSNAQSVTRPLQVGIKRKNNSTNIL